MLVTLGRAEVDSILAEQGAVSVTCDFCNALYSFDAVDVGHLFATGSSDLGHPGRRH
jgi:molecular chaperone Hsp33